MYVTFRMSALWKRLPYLWEICISCLGWYLFTVYLYVQHIFLNQKNWNWTEKWKIWKWTNNCWNEQTYSVLKSVWTDFLWGSPFRWTEHFGLAEDSRTSASESWRRQVFGSRWQASWTTWVSSIDLIIVEKVYHVSVGIYIICECFYRFLPCHFSKESNQEMLYRGIFCIDI